MTSDEERCCCCEWRASHGKDEVPLPGQSPHTAAVHAPGTPKIKTLPSNGQHIRLCISLSTSPSCGQHNFHTYKRTGLLPRLLRRQEGGWKTEMLPKLLKQFSSLYHLLLGFCCCCLTLFYTSHSMWIGQCHCPLVVHQAQFRHTDCCKRSVIWAGCHENMLKKTTRNWTMICCLLFGYSRMAEAVWQVMEAQQSYFYKTCGM